MRNDNDDILSEEHFESSKTRRGSFLQKLFIFVQTFEFDLVTQSYEAVYIDQHSPVILTYVLEILCTFLEPKYSPLRTPHDDPHLFLPI